jgi:hypothetical protein
MSSGPLPFVCAWCGRVRTGPGCWEESDSRAPVAGEATHGICPECLAAETRAVSGALIPATARLLP